MHFQSLVLLTLSAGALAIPSALPPGKRHNHDSHPSIAPYNDGICTLQAGPSQDFGRGNGCVKVTWPQDNVGINWGDWPYGMGGFDVFTDDACNDFAFKTIMNTNKGNDAKGANACYAMSLHGGPWKSVRQHYDQIE